MYVATQRHFRVCSSEASKMIASNTAVCSTSTCLDPPGLLHLSCPVLAIQKSCGVQIGT
jgi:hypothetical protein